MQENVDTEEEAKPAVPERQLMRSPSQLTSYSDCPEAYRLERLAKVPRRPAAWFYHGTAVHLAIEKYEESRRTLTAQQLEDIFVDEYRRLVKEAIDAQDGSLDAFMTGGNKKPETDMQDREDQGIYQVADYVALAEEMQNDWAVVANELYFEIEIAGVKVRGYIDQVVMNLKTGFVYPRDLKTGGNLPATPVQLAIYVIALRQMTEAEPDKYPWKLQDVLANYAEWLHCGRPPSKTGKTKAKPTKIVPEDLTDWGIERVGAWLQEMDRAEKAGIYLPSPTRDCERVCGVAQFCRVVGHAESAKPYAHIGLPIVAIT